jgi:DNA polymerase III subunit delta
MALAPDQLPAALARGLPGLAVIAGEVPLLLQEAGDLIRARARSEGYEREVFDADKGFNWQQVVDAGNSLSLFASRRLIEVRVQGALGDDGAQTLMALATHPAQDVCVMVSLGALDARQRKASWYGTCERQALVVYAWPIKAEDWPAWVAGRVRQAGLDLSPDALQLLAERTEGNPLACAQDLRKLERLRGEAPIDVDTLAAAVADNARFGVFDLSDRLLAGDAVASLRSLQRLREEGTSVQEILGSLLWTLRNLAEAGAVYARTRDLATAVGQIRIRPQQQGAYRAALSRMHPAEPLGWLRQALQVDQLSKSTGGEPAAWRDLITLVTAASGAAPRHSRR